jgi:hypothetical protein
LANARLRSRPPRVPQPCNKARRSEGHHRLQRTPRSPAHRQRIAVVTMAPLSSGRTPWTTTTLLLALLLIVTPATYVVALLPPYFDDACENIGPPVIGVDLGTTYSRVGDLASTATFGWRRSSSPTTQQGNRITPSWLLSTTAKGERTIIRGPSSRASSAPWRSSAPWCSPGRRRRWRRTSARTSRAPSPPSRPASTRRSAGPRSAPAMSSRASPCSALSTSPSRPPWPTESPTTVAATTPSPRGRSSSSTSAPRIRFV